MQKLILTVLSLIFIFPFLSFGQNDWHFGAYVKANWVTQTYRNPAAPGQGRSQFESFLTTGAGIYGHTLFTERHGLETRLGYIRKGNLDAGNGLIVGSNPFTPSGDFKNKFDYLNLDLVYHYRILKKDITPVIGLGFQNSFLINHEIGSDVDPWNKSYPFDRFEPVRNYGLAYLISLGLEIREELSFLLEFNRDLTPVIKGESLSVKNMVFSLQMNVRIF
jgi:hypothetical protein